MSCGRGSFWTGVLFGATASAIALMWMARSSDEDANDTTTTTSTRKDTNSRASSAQRPGRSSHRGFGFLANRNVKESSFLTDIMEQLWPYIRVAGAETIRSSVEPSFAALPGPMKTCRFTQLDLGSVPLRMDNIVVHPLQADGSVQFDMDLHWDGECDFQLKADYVGSFGIRHLKLNGRMSIILKPLTNELPIVSGIQYGFINMPTIELSFSGLASLADLSILESTVQDAIKSSLSTSVLPYRRLYKMKDTNNYLDTYQPPVGVLRLTALRGHGFVLEKRLLAAADIPDVYLNISIGQEAIWRTKTIKNSTNPAWNEIKDFCLYDREQQIQINAWDDDDGPLDPDDELGIAKVTVADMLLSPRRTITLPLTVLNKSNKKSERTGASVVFSCDICEWTSDLSSLSSERSDSLSTEICGLLVVIVNRAFDIPLDPKIACTFVKLTYASKEYSSKMIYSYPGWDPVNPIYDTAFTIPIGTDMPRDDKATIQLDLIHLAGDTPSVLGSNTLAFGDLKGVPDHTITETRPMGDKGASLQFRVSLSGVAPPPSKETTVDIPPLSSRSPGSSFDTSVRRSDPTIGNRVSFDIDDMPSAGSFQLTVVKARGLQIRHEFFSFDVPDVYFEIEFEKEIFKTSVKHNNITPEWNESKKWKLADHGQSLLVRGWDKGEGENHPDIPIGAVKLTIGKLLLAGGSLDLELMSDADLPTGVFVTLRAQMI